MDWKKASIINAKRLERALDVERFARQLAELPQARQAGITKTQLDALSEEREQAERQRQRLEKGEFRIAVVGLEKAGKSTFVNAWLGSDLLPAKSLRCTFTTTQIFSVKEETEQRLETQPKTNSEFSKLVAELKSVANGSDETRAKNAKEDLATIQQHQTTLKEVLNEGARAKHFTNLEEIKEPRSYAVES